MEATAGRGVGRTTRCHERAPAYGGRVEVGNGGGMGKAGDHDAAEEGGARGGEGRGALGRDHVAGLVRRRCHDRIYGRALSRAILRRWR
jgi:hypothetical protein